MAVNQKAKEKPAERQTGFCCYIGPGIPGAVSAGQVFRGSREEAVKVIAGRLAQNEISCPLGVLSSLVVESRELAAARAQVRVPGSGYYTAYQKVKEACRNG